MDLAQFAADAADQNKRYRAKRRRYTRRYYNTYREFLEAAGITVRSGGPDLQPGDELHPGDDEEG